MATKKKTEKIQIGLSDKDRNGIVAILNITLADEFLLYAKTRNYHWNVVGPNFGELHKFFEAQYVQLDVIMDSVAERARVFRGNAIGTLAKFAKTSRLKEKPGVYPDAKTMISDLLNDHESLIRNLRDDLDMVDEKYNDAGTSDFLTGIMEEHEKMAWMLRATLG